MTAADALLDSVVRAEKLLVALDFDGTLAPFEADPMRARATPEARRAVARLAAAPGVTVAFVSGRSLADLRVIAEHDDASPIWLEGSHGAEQWRPGGVPVPAEPEAPPETPAVLEAAHRAAEGFEGAWIEDKRFGFGLHTRTSPEGVEPRAQAALDAIVADLAPTWRRREGKHVLEFAWRHEGKDDAVARLREETAADAVVFAGDDVTDEDALASLRDGDLGIRVGAGPTAARLTVADTPALAEVLEQLAARRASGNPPRE